MLMDKVPPYKRPLNYADDKSLNANDKELVTNLDLSRTEFERYNSLAPFVKASIIQLLTERKRLNDYVKNYLQEKISEQFGQFMQLLWPTEHSLKYALQKVDESEDKINKHLESEGLQLFDKNTTMKNRLKILLATAYAYQDELDQQIAETFQSNQSRTAIAIQEKKSKKKSSHHHRTPHTNRLW